MPLRLPDERLPGGESFAWQVLSALADEVSATVDGTQASIRLTKRRPKRRNRPITALEID